MFLHEVFTAYNRMELSFYFTLKWFCDLCLKGPRVEFILRRGPTELERIFKGFALPANLKNHDVCNIRVNKESLTHKYLCGPYTAILNATGGFFLRESSCFKWLNVARERYA
jgi:hypothetical protein